MAILCVELKIIKQVHETKFCGVEVSIDLDGKIDWSKLETDPFILKTFERIDELAKLQANKDEDE